MTTPLHKARLEKIVSELRNSNAASVLDLGCGQGELLLHLRDHDQFERIVGIDIDTRALAGACMTLGINWNQRDRRVIARSGSFESMDPDLTGFDAAVMLETIEHIKPARLSRVERNLFSYIRPHTILITTPNQEYNVLYGMQPGERRHPDHKFEWTRMKFQSWSVGIAERHGYTVSFSDIGEIDPLFGGATQMAKFTTPGKGPEIVPPHTWT